MEHNKELIKPEKELEINGIASLIHHAKDGGDYNKYLLDLKFLIVSLLTQQREEIYVKFAQLDITNKQDIKDFIQFLSNPKDHE